MHQRPGVVSFSTCFSLLMESTRTSWIKKKSLNTTFTAVQNTVWASLHYETWCIFSGTQTFRASSGRWTCSRISSRSQNKHGANIISNGFSATRNARNRGITITSCTFTRSILGPFYFYLPLFTFNISFLSHRSSNSRSGNATRLGVAISRPKHGQQARLSLDGWVLEKPPISRENWSRPHRTC